MIDIDLDAIRKRDKDWRHDGKQSSRNRASLDRRALLAYLDEIEALVEEIGVDIKLIKKVQREHYRVTPLESATQEQMNQIDQELADFRNRGGDNFRDSAPPGKLPP